MKDLFIHDATPTWSGFIYQGQIAVYLAVKTICDLKENEQIKIEDIASNYAVEVEKCEDIAIVQKEGKDKKYLSIHQVKNQKDNNIGKYRSPLIQLMLEKGFYTKAGLGTPKAYLHVSNKIRKEDKDNFSQTLSNWRDEILNFYNKLKILTAQIDSENMKEMLDGIKKLADKEPVGFHRTSYTELINTIKNVCKKEHVDLAEVKQKMQGLINYLDEYLAVPCINQNVELYPYEDGNTFCSGEDIFKKIVAQVKRYNKAIAEKEYEYIAHVLLHYVRRYIIERHKQIQEEKVKKWEFSLGDIIEKLDECLAEYNENANVFTLRTMFDNVLADYCSVLCEKECRNESGKNIFCQLKQMEERIANLKDEDFKKFCYVFNPDCKYPISDRECLGSLLNKTGLRECVFEIVNKVVEKSFIREKSKIKIVIDNDNKNAFLTAIPGKKSKVVVSDIVQGIRNNPELISPIFEADQLITADLEADASVWESNYSEIQECYVIEKKEMDEDDNSNSICRPKKPFFVKAEEIIKNCSGSELEVEECESL